MKAVFLELLNNPKSELNSMLLELNDTCTRGSTLTLERVVKTVLLKVWLLKFEFWTKLLLFELQLDDIVFDGIKKCLRLYQKYDTHQEDTASHSASKTEETI